MHQVYRLNLPNIDNINFNQRIRSDLKMFDYAILHDLPNIIDEKILNLKNIHWDCILYWKKFNFIGNIHRDTTPYSYKHDRLGQWGINWTWNGDTLIQYWNIEDCEYTQFGKSSDNIENAGAVPFYKTNKKPFATYELLANKCYLVNGHLPHRAIGIGDRESISLRPADYIQMPWKSVITLFSDIILDWSTQEKQYNVDAVIEQLTPKMN